MLENRGWIARAQRPNRTRATWAAVAFALLSLLVQALDLWRSDLKPLLEISQKNQVALERVLQRVEDHERRIGELEQARQSNGVWKRARP